MQQQILQTIDLIDAVLNDNNADKCLAALSSCTESYREETHLESFFTWLDFACAEGYDTACEYAEDMYQALGLARQYFQEQLN